jgi:hypothetical protein
MIAPAMLNQINFDAMESFHFLSAGKAQTQRSAHPLITRHFVLEGWSLRPRSFGAHTHPTRTTLSMQRHHS